VNLFNVVTKITGGSIMEKNKSQDDLNLSLKRKAYEETLEISSSGYGYVYATNETEEEQRLDQKK
jgi:hypothetical protein